MQPASKWLIAQLENGWLDWTRLFGKIPSEDHESFEALHIASGYCYAEEDSEAREQGGPYIPLFMGPSGMSAPFVEDVDPQMLQMWGTIIDEVDHPSVTARLADLLWLRSVNGSEYRRAEQAIEALIGSSSEESYGDFERVCMLARASELALQIKRLNTSRHVADRALVFATAFLNAPDFMAGLFFRALQILINTDAQNPVNVDLLNRVLTREDVHETDRAQFRELLIALPASVGVDKPAVIEAQITDSIQTALELSPPLRIDVLQRALKFAYRNQRIDLANEVKLHIQQTPPIDFALINAEAKVPRKVIDTELARFSGANTWADVLDALKHSYIGCGTYAEVREQQESIRSEYPLSFFFTHQLIKNGNQVIRTAETPEEIMKIRVSQSICTFASIYAALVLKVWEDLCLFERLDPGDMEGIESGVLDQKAAEAVQRSIGFFANGDTEVACCVLLPQIERVIRDICIHENIPVFGSPRGNTPGKNLSLGILIKNLIDKYQGLGTREAEGFAEMLKFWRLFLVDSVGLNLRNEYLHGLRSYPQQADMVILLYIVACLRGTKRSFRESDPLCCT